MTDHLGQTDRSGWIGAPPSPRYVWWCFLLWFVAGVVCGLWAANGFPMGVAL